MRGDWQPVGIVEPASGFLAHDLADPTFGHPEPRRSLANIWSPRIVRRARSAVRPSSAHPVAPGFGARGSEVISVVAVAVVPPPAIPAARVPHVTTAGCEEKG